MPPPMTLAQRANEQLAAAAPPRGFEDLFWRAALTTLAAGKIVDPDVAALHARLQAVGAFGALSIPAGFQVGRVTHLKDFTLLAIAHGDLHALTTMRAIWCGVDEPADPWCAGWVDLFVRGTVLDDALVESLVEEQMLDDDSAADRAWRALHARQPALARRELVALAEATARCWRDWEAQPDVALVYARQSPGLILALPQRAIAAVLARWHAP